MSTPMPVSRIYDDVLKKHREANVDDTTDAGGTTDRGTLIPIMPFSQVRDPPSSL